MSFADLTEAGGPVSQMLMPMAGKLMLAIGTGSDPPCVALPTDCLDDPMIWHPTDWMIQERASWMEAQCLL